MGERQPGGTGKTAGQHTQGRLNSLKAPSISLKGIMRIAMFIGSLPGGGAERTFLTLARAFAEYGHGVDVVVSQLRGEFVREIPTSVSTVVLGRSGYLTFLREVFPLPQAVGRKLLPLIIRSPLKKIRSLPHLTRYLNRARPDVLLASTTVPNLISLWAAQNAKVRTAVFVKQDNTILEATCNDTGPLVRIIPELVGDWYPRADGIVTVSSGLRDEIQRITDVPRDRLHVIYNPADLQRIARLSEERLDDPWFQSGQPPALVSAGRLHPQKDFPTLLRAMKLLGSEPKMRLVIIGEGQERPALEALIRQLALWDHVRLIGFKANPYVYMSRASAFVLSSSWEGLSNVLIEALACGCRIVSTDCPYGPSEILRNGEYGVLVPVRNPEALATAIHKILSEPSPKEKNKQRSQMYDIQAIAAQYLGLFSSVKKYPPESW